MGDINLRRTDSLSLFNIFSQMNVWVGASRWVLVFLVCEFCFNVLQIWVVYDAVLGSIPDIISDQNTWNSDWR